MKTLLRVQELDLKIEAFKARELQIPKQKGKFEVCRKRLADEREEREKTCRDLLIEQRAAEGEIEEKQTHIKKYDQQLFAVKKNEEYQALLHEIDLLKKQIGVKEERVISIMVEIDESRARLKEDKTRIQAELDDIARQCAEIDAELEATVADRTRLEAEYEPLARQVDRELMERYRRIRVSKKTGAAAVPLNDEVCSGCHMHVPAQIVNEVMGATKIHTCNHCGRILYHPDNVAEEPADA